MDDTSHSACESWTNVNAAMPSAPHHRISVSSNLEPSKTRISSESPWMGPKTGRPLHQKNNSPKNPKNMTFHFSSFFWFPKKFGFAFFPHVPSVGKNVTKHPRRMLLPMRRNTRTWRRNSLFFHHLNTNNTTRQYEIIEDTIKIH